MGLKIDLKEMKMFCTNGQSMIKSIQRRKNGILEPNHVKKWY